MQHNRKIETNSNLVLEPYEDTSSKQALLGVLRIIVDDMNEQISRGKPGPDMLDYDTVYQLVARGALKLQLSSSTPPRPEFVVVL